MALRESLILSEVEGRAMLIQAASVMSYFPATLVSA
jgi:hypothetical protein